MPKPNRKPGKPPAGLWAAKEGTAALKAGKPITSIIVHKRLNGGQKGIIGKLDRFGATYWIYYPKKEHFQTFKKAVKFVRPGGPASLSPGSVGVIKTEHLNPNSNYRAIFIKTMQSSFMTGKPSKLNRSLATKYGGWRQHILDEIFAQVLKEKIGVAFEIPEIQGEKPNSPRERMKIFIDAAKRHGFKVQEIGTMLYAQAT